MSQDAPSDAGELVGERDGEDVVMQSFLRRFEPRLEPVSAPNALGPALTSTAQAAWTNRARR